MPIPPQINVKVYNSRIDSSSYAGHATTASYAESGFGSFSGSFSGSFNIAGTSASFALNSELAQNASASLSASVAQLAYAGTGSFTGAFSGDASGLTGVSSASLAQLSYALTGSATGSFKGDGSGIHGVPSASYATSAGSAIFASSSISASVAQLTYAGSGSFTGSFKGSGANLTGVNADSALTATSASVAQLAYAGTGSFTGSFKGDGFNVLNVVTSSYATNAGAATTAISASYAANAGGSSISSSYAATSSLATVATQATSASYATNSSTANSATSASFASNALTANSATSAVSATSASVAQLSYALTGSATGSFKGDGSGILGIITSSYATMAATASFALSNGSGSGLTQAQADARYVALGGDMFTGSYNLTGSFTASAFKGDGSNLTGLVSASYATNAGTTTIANTASFATSANTANTATSASVAQLAYAGTGSFTGSFKGSGTNIIGVVSASYAANAGTSNTATSSSFATSALTANSTTSASYALTASYAANGSGNSVSSSFATAAKRGVSGFEITGSLIVSGGQQSQTVYNYGNSALNRTIDWTRSNLQKLTLTGSCTFSFSNPTSGAFYQIQVIQDSTGNRQINWPTSVTWDGDGSTPSGSLISGSTDLYIFYYDGVNYYGSSFAALANQTASVAQLAYSGTGSFTGSFKGDGSGVLGVISSSYAQTASFALFALASGSGITQAQGDARYVLRTGDNITGSFNITGSITGSRFKGDGSNITGVVSASYTTNAGSANSATSSSFATNALTANSATSASYALTASYAANGGGASVSSSYATNAGSANNATSASFASNALTANSATSASVAQLAYAVTGSVTGTLKGDGSGVLGVISSSYAQTASFALFALSSGSGITQAQGDARYILRSGDNVTGSFNISGSVTGSRFKGDGSNITGVISSSYASNAGSANSATSASFATNALTANSATSASFATSAKRGVSGFEVTGSMIVSGGAERYAVYDYGNSALSRTVNLALGNFYKLTLTGSCTFSLSNPVAGTMYQVQVNQDATGGRQINWPSSIVWDGDGSTPSGSLSSGSTDLYTLYYDGAHYFGSSFAALGNVTASYALTVISASYALTASYAANGGGTSVSASYATNAGSANNATSASFATNALTANSATSASVAQLAYAGTGSFTGSFKGSGANLTGLVSASYATNAGSANNATSASFASNALTANSATSASVAQLAYAGTGSFTGSFKGDGTGILNVISSSYALTSSYAANAVGGGLSQGQGDARYVLRAGDSLTGSFDISGSVTGSRFKGDGSNITGVVSSSYATNAGTANIVSSASFATVSKRGIGGFEITGSLIISGGQQSQTVYNHGNSALSRTINFATSNLQKLILTGSCTLSFSNPSSGAFYQLQVIQDSTGNRQINWPSSIVWDGDGSTPSGSLVSGSSDLYMFYYDGAHYFGSSFAALGNQTASVALTVISSSYALTSSYAANAVGGGLSQAQGDARYVLRAGDNVTGSFNITGSVTGSRFKGDGSNITGVVSASYATNAGSANNATSASFATNALTANSATSASVAQLAYAGTGSFTGSFKGDGANVSGIISSSYALTASYAANGSGNSVSSSFATSAKRGVGGFEITGSLIVSGGQASHIIFDNGNSALFRTIDWSLSNLQKLTLTGSCTLSFSNPLTGASYVVHAIQDASGGRQISWPSSIVWDANGIVPSGSLTSGSTDIYVFYYDGAHYYGSSFDAVGSLTASMALNSISSSYAQTALTVITASYAQTASYALFALSSGSGITQAQGDARYILRSGDNITGSFDISGSVTGSRFKGDGSNITGVISSSYALTASYAANGGGSSISASYATNAGSANNATSSSFSTTSSLATNIRLSRLSTVLTTPALSASAGTLALGSFYTGTITLLSEYMLLTVSSSVDARVRLYINSSSLISDISRSMGSDPSASAGVVTELMFSGSTKVVRLTPLVFGYNSEGTISNNIPIIVENKTGSVATPSITFTYIPL